MLAELQRAAPENVVAIEAQAEDVDVTWGSFRLVTAGRSFHWFDAPLVLGRLAEITPTVARLGDFLHESEIRVRALGIATELLGEATTEKRKSMSVTSPERLGEHRAEFEDRVRRELAGAHHERATSDAVVGRRAAG